MSFVVFVMFPIFMVAYVVLVTFGYDIGISKLWPILGDHGALALAFCVALFVWTLAVLVARTHLSRSDITSRYLSGALFFILYLTSGFGIANFLFFQLEGPTVLGQAIERAETGTTALQNTAAEKLIPQDFRSMEERVNSSFSQLEGEIRNATVVGPVSYCGVGIRARLAIAEIAQYLPNFRELAGTDNKSLNCNNKAQLDSVVQQYRTMLNQQLQTAPLAMQLRIKDRRSLLDQIALFNRAARGDLAGQRQTVSAMSFKAQNEAADFVTVLQHLESLEGQYTGLRQQLSSFIPLSPGGLPPTFDLTAASHIGSFTSTIDVIAHRILRGEGSFANVLYFLVPLFIDFLIVILIFSVLRRPSRYQTQRTRSGDTVQYLLPPLPTRDLRTAAR